MIGALRRLDPTSICGLTNPNIWSTSLLSHFFFFFAGYMHMHACVLQATYAKITSVFVAHSGAGAKKLRHT